MVNSCGWSRVEYNCVLLFSMAVGYIFRQGEEIMDILLVEFIKENLITISLILAALKVVAKETPWATDDRILEIFTGFLNRTKREK